MYLFLLTFLGCFDKITENELNQDLDDDGYTAFDGDCDDNDPNLLSEKLDRDCDGILTADDCNDSNPLQGARAALRCLRPRIAGASRCPAACTRPGPIGARWGADRPPCPPLRARSHDPARRRAR